MSASALGVGHLVDRVDDLPGLAALQDGDDEPLVLLGELAGAVGDVLVDGLGLDPQRRAGAGDAAADAGARARPSTAAGAPPLKPADLLDGGDHAVRRVAVLEPRGDQQPAVAAGAGRVDGGLGGLVELDGTTMPGSTTRSETNRTGRRVVDMRGPTFGET